MEIVLSNGYPSEMGNREIKRITVIVEFNDIGFPKPFEKKTYTEYRYSKTFLSLLSNVKTFFSCYFDNNNIRTEFNKVSSSSCVDDENLNIVYTDNLIDNL